jgi:anion-transporting  ArsA/GET3 family ATPase
MSVPDLLEAKRVCVVAGAGGVGKTTISASVAIGMAARGLKVAVVTIDPARRLADALGLEQLTNEPRRVDAELVASAAGVHVRGVEGELWAMMLDAKRTLDDLVGLLAESAQAREQLLRNRIYQQLSGAVAGTQEFSAVAKLYELGRGDFDLLVLDTPPARNALDFIEAPDRIASFLEGRALGAFLRPAGLGARLLGGGAGLVFAALRRITGVDLLEDLSVFFRAFGGVIDGFHERAREVNLLLRDPASTFLLVTSAERTAIDEAISFAAALDAAGIPFGGVAVNRVHHDQIAEVDVEEIVGDLSAELSPRLANEVGENLRDYHRLVVHDRGNLAHVSDSLAPHPVIQVPQFDRDIHDRDGLLWLHRYLFASDAEHARLMGSVVS